MQFEEDLVQILRLMGHEIDKTTSLTLIDDSGKEVHRDSVRMTEGKPPLDRDRAPQRGKPIFLERTGVP